MKIDNGTRIMTTDSGIFTAETFGDKLLLFISAAGGLLTIVGEDGIFRLPDRATIDRLVAEGAVEVMPRLEPTGRFGAGEQRFGRRIVRSVVGRDEASGSHGHASWAPNNDRDVVELAEAAMDEAATAALTSRRWTMESAYMDYVRKSRRTHDGIDDVASAPADPDVFRRRVNAVETVLTEIAPDLLVRRPGASPQTR